MFSSFAGTFVEVLSLLASVADLKKEKRLGNVSWFWGTVKPAHKVSEKRLCGPDEARGVPN